MHFPQSTKVLAASIALTLAGCSSDGGGGFGGGNAGGGSQNPWQPGVFLDANTFFARCEAPRSGTNPFSGNPFPDIQGTVLDENNFLRSLTDEIYLWYSEVTDRDPGLYDNTLTYFDLLKTEETTPSGTPKDQFHFTYDSQEWFELSQLGTSSGYGMQVAILSPSAPRRAVVAYSDPGTPADLANLARGAEFVSVDGVDFVNGTDVDTINAGLFPATDGETHTFEVRDLGSQVTREVTLTSASVSSTPVQNTRVIDTPTGRVGYLVFNDHIATAEDGLIDAVNTLNQGQGIVDLVIDVRYNGGGFLDLASEFAYMIAGPANTAGRTFELLEWNDKHPATNPVTGRAISPMPFHSTTQGFGNRPAGQALPSLDLSRVFVITGPGTCSASESIMNGLIGIGVEVVQIGSTTCGKPYGFYPIDNCGTTYFTVQFRGVNDAGFGDFSDGFRPANDANLNGTTVTGCSVADDFGAALGDPAEGRLAAALNYRDNQTCPTASGTTLPGVSKTTASADENLLVPKSIWLKNRILRDN